MSFTFRGLHLENWLAYSGRMTIRFPAFERGRNLIVIYGRNGYGKTSLLRALRYVFEGERLSRDELLSLWHHAARDAGEGSLEKIKAELEAEREKIRAIEKDLENLREKKNRRAYLNERMREVDGRIQNVVTNLPLLLLRDTLQQIVEGMRAREEVSPRAQALDARLRTLKELVGESICLCGRDIDSKVRIKLNEQLSSLEKLIRGPSRRRCR